MSRRNSYDALNRLSVTYSQAGGIQRQWNYSYDRANQRDQVISDKYSWQLTGLSVPVPGTIRARGYTTGGQYNGSAWFVETLLPIDGGATQSPGLAITLQAGRPALQVAGKAGEQYVIEYVPALPATGNGLFQSSFLLTNSPQTLIDPTFTGESKRFYRVRANP